MKKYNPAYYLLFILLVMGTFASMAQNNYGLKLMGAVAFIFGLIFLLQFIGFLQKKGESRLLSLVECACLFVISIVLGLRVLYIYSLYLEYLFVAASFILAGSFVYRMIGRYRHYSALNRTLATLLLFYHSSLILFLLAMALLPYAPAVSNTGGIAAFAALVIFLLGVLVKKELPVEAEKISPLRLVTRFKDHSMIIITLLILFFLFTGLNRVGLLPDIYSDQYPRAYFNLVNEAADNKEKEENGKYQYQLFLEQYQKFVDHNKDLAP